MAQILMITGFALTTALVLWPVTRQDGSLQAIRVRARQPQTRQRTR
jgi:hypothetical protein